MGSYQDDALFALLAVIGSGGGPIGTRAAQRSLEGMGFSMSESSVSRRLRDLDRRGWTSRVGTKGRVLSPTGRQQLAEARRSVPVGTRTDPILDVKDIQDVLDLLIARKAVESAAAADAAKHANSEDADSLQALLDDHHRLIVTGNLSEQPGLGFHRKVATISSNSKLKVLTGLILAPHLDEVETVLDIILGSEEHQKSALEDHQDIANAVARNEPEQAENAMRNHFSRMIEETETLLRGDGKSLIERLLNWAGPSSRAAHDENLQQK